MSNLPTIRTPYYFGTLALIALSASVFVSYWWLIAAMPLSLQTLNSWRFYCGTPWKRLYFPLKRALQQELGFEHGVCLREGRELDTNVPVLRMISRYRPEWSGDEILDFAEEQDLRFRAFVDEAGLRAEAHRQFRDIDDEKLDAFIDRTKDYFADYPSDNFHVVIMAGIIERELGAEQRAAFLFRFAHDGLG